MSRIYGILGEDDVENPIIKSIYTNLESALKNPLSEYYLYYSDVEGALVYDIVGTKNEESGDWKPYNAKLVTHDVYNINGKYFNTDYYKEIPEEIYLNKPTIDWDKLIKYPCGKLKTTYKEGKLIGSKFVTDNY